MPVDSQTSANVKLSAFSRLLLRVAVPWVFVLGYLFGVGLQLTIFPRAYLSATAAHVVFISGEVLFVAGAIMAGSGLILFHNARTTTTPGEASKALVIR